jgi:hypothetical protein
MVPKLALRHQWQNPILPNDAYMKGWCVGAAISKEDRGGRILDLARRFKCGGQI